MNDTCKQPKVKVDREAVIAAIKAAPAPEGGWGEIKIILGQPCRIEFANRAAMLQLGELLGFGSQCYVGMEKWGWRILRHKFPDLIKILNRKAGIKAKPSTTVIDPATEVEEYAKAIDKAKSKGIELLFEIGRNLKLAHDQLAKHGKTSQLAVSGDFCIQLLESSHTLAVSGCRVNILLKRYQ